VRYWRAAARWAIPGVPDDESDTIPFSSTPARSHERMSFSIWRSTTRLLTSAIKASWSMEPKQSDTSASSTQSAPWLASTLMASTAIWAERFGRKPKLAGRKSASKMGSRTSFAAAMTTRSETVGIPRGRVAPGVPGLGMCTRRRGFGR